HQLLVGISEYPRLQAQSQLRFAHKDALDLGAVLAAPAGQARILVNGQATLRGILANLEDLTHRARPGDWALVLLSGHGGFAGVLNSEWCFLPHDVEPGDFPEWGSRHVWQRRHRRQRHRERGQPWPR